MQFHNRAEVCGQCETVLVGRVSSCCGSSDFSCSDIAHTLHASTKVKKIEAPLGIDVQIVRMRSAAACDSLVEALEVNTTTRHSYLLSLRLSPLGHAENNVTLDDDCFNYQA